MSHDGSAPVAPEPVEQQQTPSQPSQPSQPVDRREALRAAFDKAEESAPAEPKPGAAPAQRARDANGQFLPKEPAAPAVPEPKPWDKAPQAWKQNKHALWAAMAPEAREYAYQREQEMQAGVDPLLPKAALADAISQVAAPYMDTIRGLGIELPQAVGALMQIDHQLRTLPYEQKMQVLTQAMRAYGIDLSGQASSAQPMAQQPVMSPHEQMLTNQVVQMQGQWNAFQQQQEASAQREALDEIQKFSTTAELFEEAKPAMIQLLNSGFADGLADAYDKAVRLSPELFQKQQAAQQAAAAAERSAAADAAAKRAKAAAVSPKSATPGAQKPSDAKDRRSILREQFDSLSERF